MIKKYIIAVSLLTICFTSMAQQPVNAVFKIEDKIKAAISPRMYGIFFEDINFAGDGGLYAEMVRNRSFEDIRPPESCRIEGDWAVTPGNFRWYIGVSDSFPSWKLTLEPMARASMHLDTAFPLNSAQYYSLRLNIDKSSRGKVTLSNDGYYGMAVRKGEGYNFSFYARSIKPLKKPVSISLQDDAGNVYASASIEGIGVRWLKYAASLTANGDHTRLRLCLTFEEPTTLWLDMVSLFPANTWKNRSNGWRADLMQMLADLQPKFLRFPGGCVVEGITFDNAIQWKETIGDIAQRPGHVNVWGYRSTDGIGYHEFLQMAEDLGCEPLFVVNVGMTCQARNSYSMPLDQLQPMIDDVLDAIEYANGPVTSKWGALRAQNGHPKPFNLKYLEVGNENWGEDYDVRYEKFYDAIKARYPDIIIIRSAHPTADKNPLYFPNNKGEILDLHYYRSPDWIFRNHNIFDDYPRTDKKVYIGEFACNEKVGRGNLYAALADAVFMVSFERNADLITMASYAPLFENEDKDGYKWPVNLIHFNNHQVYAMPSYYVQQMFFKNTGHQLLASVLTSDSVNIPLHYSLNGGSIGFDTYSTEAMFDDVCVTSNENGDTLFFENFESNATKFPLMAENGSWTIENGVLHQTDASLFAHAYMGDTSWTNYTLSFKAKRISGNEGFFMTLYRKDNDNWLKWNIGGWNNTQHALEMRSNGSNAFIAPMVSGSVRTNEWYNVKIKVNGLHIQCYLNDTLVHDVTLPDKATYQRIYGVTTLDTINNEIIVKLVNPFNEPAKVRLLLPPYLQLQPTAQILYITADNSLETNSFDYPQKIVPQKKQYNGIKNDMIFDLNANSVTFLRLKKN
ncbi:MAG TPA: alpha-L-arabinofuranosidase C-terminal domain-containing protein [Bacteroidales bacterium]|nr:alpha-L-arabinofuranosidase C-terminal domain-containing protein [Bacteroidales bacterium]HPO65431.1 alpha-L-arabinofuranosidase C-terminal domain-containing protein [Bacteroidales bacterium]